jgi:hypothetical protein
MFAWSCRRSRCPSGEEFCVIPCGWMSFAVLCQVVLTSLLSRSRRSGMDAIKMKVNVIGHCTPGCLSKPENRLSSAEQKRLPYAPHKPLESS